MILRRKNKGTLVKVDGNELIILFLLAFTSKVEFGGTDFTVEIRSFLFIFWIVLSVYDSYFYEEEEKN